MCKKYTLCIAVIIALCGMLWPLYADWGWEQNDYQLTDNNRTDRTSMNHAWSIAVSKPSSDHYVHVVWQHDTSTAGIGYQIRYRRNTDYGASASWQTGKMISRNVEDCAEPSVAAARAYVYVVWHAFDDPEYNIYFNRSTNSGANWDSLTTSAFFKGSSSHPVIAAIDSFVHVVWLYDGDSIFYKRSSDYGEHWSTTRSLGRAYADSRASIAASDSFVHVVWHSRWGSYREVFYKRSINYGADWSDSIQLSSDDANKSTQPSVAAYGNYVHVVWKERVQHSHPLHWAWEIYYIRNTNYGSDRWSRTTQISDDHDSETEVDYPSIAGADSYVLVTWPDDRGAFRKIYYCRSQNNGANWGSDSILSDPTRAGNDWSSVATLETFAYVVWTDYRDSPTEIYFQRWFEQSRGNRGGGFDILNASAISSGVKFGGHVLAVSPITFRIYDVVGREVSSFVHRPVSTEFSYLWKPNNLASGIYFVRASQKDGYQAKAKIVWVK